MPVQSDTNRKAWSETVPELEDHAPSAKLVARVLDLHGELSQQSIIEETFLPARTVRYAVKKLDEDDLVEVQYCRTDARRRFYRLALDSRKPESETGNATAALIESE